AVTLRPGLLATTIGVEDASKQFSLTNAELSNVTTTGVLTVGSTTNTGGITIGTDALVNQSTALTFLSAGNIVLNANGLTDAGAVTLTTSGAGAITTNGPLATTGNRNINLTTTNAPITTNGTITAAGSGTVVLTARGAVNGILTINNAITSGSGAITLTAADVNINAPLSSTGALTLQPVTASQDIGIAGGAGTFSLDSGDIANLTDGFSSITIGRSDGSGVITVDAVTFKDPATIRAPSGRIVVAGPITGTDNASIFLDSSRSVGQQIALNAGITTAGQLISLDNVVLGADVTLDTTNAGASPAGANITFRNTTIDADSAANSRALTLTAGTGGAVTLPGAVGGTQALGALTVSSSSAVTVAAVTTSGNISLTTGGTLTVAGPIASGTGAIDLTGSSIVQNANVSTAGTGTITATATTGPITMADGTTSSTTPGTGDINYTAAGTITLATLSAGGAAGVNSTGGSILDGNVAPLNVATGAGATLQAGGGIIGTLAAPIDVQVTNLANVNATGQVAGVSIVINGTTGDNTLHFPFTVPGRISFNGVLLNPLPSPPNVPPGALLEPIQGLIVTLQGSGPGAVAVKLAPSASVMLSACETSTASGDDKLLAFCPPDSEPVETSP
ncbi:MAG: hypothetical protein Q7W02_05055, partial [Candidatus Rokubacteria bacterium]|nr:hypothetical protein [Candidatus Rokubacteria bacterium]